MSSSSKTFRGAGCGAGSGFGSGAGGSTACSAGCSGSVVAATAGSGTGSAAGSTTGSATGSATGSTTGSGTSFGATGAAGSTAAAVATAGATGSRSGTAAAAGVGAGVDGAGAGAAAGVGATTDSAAGTAARTTAGGSATAPQHARGVPQGITSQPHATMAAGAGQQPCTTTTGTAHGGGQRCRNRRWPHARTTSIDSENTSTPTSRLCRHRRTGHLGMAGLRIWNSRVSGPTNASCRRCSPQTPPTPPEPRQRRSCRHHLYDRHMLPTVPRPARKKAGRDDSRLPGPPRGSSLPTACERGRTLRD